MSYATHDEGDLDAARDDVLAEIDRFKTDILDEVPTCSGRGISDFDLSIPAIVADAVAKARLYALSEISQRIRRGA